MITAMPRIAIAINDFEAAVETFRKKFGMPVVDISDSSVEALGAKLAMCVPQGGSNVELMCPANPDTPLSQSLQRFLDRRGEGLFALMLEAPVPDAEADRLLDKGMRVLPLMEGASGRDIHPKSTHGVLIRIYPENSFEGTTQGDADTDLALSGIARGIIAVEDVDKARTVYGDKIELSVDPVVDDEDRGVHYAICHPPSGGTIELVAPADESRPFAEAVRSTLAARGEGLFAIVLQSAEPVRVAKVLTSRELEVREVATHTIEVEAFGARIFIERNQALAV